MESPGEALGTPSAYAVAVVGSRYASPSRFSAAQALLVVAGQPRPGIARDHARQCCPHLEILESGEDQVLQQLAANSSCAHNQDLGGAYAGEHVGRLRGREKGSGGREEGECVDAAWRAKCETRNHARMDAPAAPRGACPGSP